MTGVAGMRVVVVGAGALGSVLAFMLQADGAKVVLVDPAALGDNASGVAAGMLAPAFETVLDSGPDSGAVDDLELLLAAREAWLTFASRLDGLNGRIVRCGAMWVGDEASQADTLARLRALGLGAEPIGAADAERASPGLRAPFGAIRTSEDWRLDPMAVLRTLRAAFLAAGGEVSAGAARTMSSRGVGLADGSEIVADAVILATGMPPAGMHDAPRELEVLAPIKGQIVRFPGAGPLDGPILRAPGVYIAPCGAGTVVGATMEPGVADRRLDPAVIERFRASAIAMLPHLAGASASGAAGVRASTPDGLPLAGPSSRAGVWVAMGARRNGWLLASLIARGIVDRMAGAPSDPWAPRFDPLRFATRRD